MAINLEQILKTMHARGGSDLHLSCGYPPYIRTNGELLPQSSEPPATEEDMQSILQSLASPERLAEFAASGNLDIAWELPGTARYRVNFYRELRGTAAAFREIPISIPSFEMLGLPPRLRDLAFLPKGLVLVTGPTGSGKSTTLASILDYANKQRRDHIITIEDPIEFIHKNRFCLVSQREAGIHTRSFADALRAALREDPDIILVGEMRDVETMSLALEAAETGHLVFSTLHTISASRTLERIVQNFPPSSQEQIRAILSGSLQAVISQVLIRRIDKPGRIPAAEVLLATDAVRSLIREGKTHQIPNIIQLGRELGMVSLDDSLERLVSNGFISPQSALMYAENRQRIRKAAGAS